MITITTTDVITSQQIADLFCGAFEGGSNYWLGDNYIRPDQAGGWNGIWYGDPKFWERPDFSVDFTNTDGDWESITIDRAALEAGLQKWADTSPTSFGDFRNGEDDAYTHDAFLQVLLFGEEVFG